MYHLKLHIDDLELKSLPFSLLIGPISFSLIHRGDSSGLPTDEEIVARLTAYFSTQTYLTRRKLESLCGIRTTTAVRLLRRLLDEGFLRNDGTRQQPIYLPVPGHYLLLSCGLDVEPEVHCFTIICLNFSHIEIIVIY